MRVIHWAILGMLAACGGSEEAPEPEPAAEPATEEPEPTKAKTKGKGRKAKGKGKAAAKARVFFTEPADGAKVTSPVKLVFGVDGMEVKPAGQLEENTGHHHVIIGPAGIPEGEVVPKDETHIHFGKGQTEAELELEPGEHKLTMQFADGNHTSYGDVMAATITITVEE